MEGPGAALRALATSLRDEESVISPYVRDPGGDEPSLGLLAAAGPRAAETPAEYSLLIESIREGYLLHYGAPRVLEEADADLALLAGDYLYALGLERLSRIGDLDAIRELSDLISLSAQLHTEKRGGAKELWLASIISVATGPRPGHEEAKAALRRGEPGAPEGLSRAAVAAAGRAGLDDRLRRAAEAIGFDSALGPLPERG
jgi:hypothetical protein